VTPKLEETIVLDFTTHSPTTGGVSDADSTPLVEVFEDTTDTAIITPTPVKRTGKTGNYRVSVDCTAANGFEAGKSYNVVASATVGGVTGKGVVGSIQVRARSTDDVLPTASYTTPPSAASIRSEIDSNSTKLDVAVSTRLAPLIPGNTIDVDAGGAVVLQSGGVAVASISINALNDIRNKFLLVNDSLNGPTVGARTVTLSGAYGANSGALVGATLAHFTAADELIQLRVITAYDISTQTITVDQDWLVAPQDTDFIRIYENGNAIPASVWQQLIDSVNTASKLMRGFSAVLMGKSSGHDTNTPKYRDLDDTKNVIDATTDSNGNRTAVTRDLT